MAAPNKRRLFVGNIDFEMLSKQLGSLFGQYGELRDVYLPQDRNNRSTRLNKGYAFVEFRDEINAQVAMDEVNAQPEPFFGRQLLVKIADVKKDE